MAKKFTTTTSTTSTTSTTAPIVCKDIVTATTTALKAMNLTSEPRQLATTNGKKYAQWNDNERAQGKVVKAFRAEVGKAMYNGLMATIATIAPNADEKAMTDIENIIVSSLAYWDKAPEVFARVTTKATTTDPYKAFLTAFSLPDTATSKAMFEAMRANMPK